MPDDQMRGERYLALVFFVFAFSLLLTSCAKNPETAYFLRLQDRLVKDGRMRTERAPADVPVTPQSVARNFIRIATFDEHRVTAGSLSNHPQRRALLRWNMPIRVALLHDPDTNFINRRADRLHLLRYIALLREITGLDIALSERDHQNANISIAFITRASPSATARKLSAALPGIEASELEAALTPGRQILCSALLWNHKGAPYEIARALITIRSEHPSLMRRACIEEELAQALGPTNDNPHVSPSVFNDDDEFALLTLHDAAILNMLYNDRLRAGQRLTQVTPELIEMARQALVTIYPFFTGRRAHNATSSGFDLKDAP